MKEYWYMKNDLRKSVIPALFLCFILYGLYTYSENILISWILLATVYSFSIWLWINLFSFHIINFKCKTLSLIGGILGGIFGGITLSLIYVLIINYSIDEGYFLLLAFILALLGAIAGIFFGIYSFIFQIDNETRFLHSGKVLMTFFYSVVFIVLISITAYNYWEILDLNNPLSLSTDKSNVFNCSYQNYKSESTENVSSKDQIIEFLKNRTGGNFLTRGEKSMDIFAVLYLLSRDETWADEFKKKLLEEAKNSRFTDISGSSKAWQYEVMVRGYYYDRLSRVDPGLFNNTENELILGWFKILNERAFKVIWVDYIYDSIFKKMPDGIYENQEIGIGMISVLSDVLENKYPELSVKDKEYINKYAVGWKGNFRNPDDGIVYHQQFWIKNAYMMAKYGGQENYINSSNARNSFDWVLFQWPPNGMSPAYNSPYTYTPFDIMVLGSEIFPDGSYSWLANSMLKNEMENPDRDIDSIIGLEYWPNGSTPIAPNVGSCYISGTTGIAPKPGPIKPDKIVLREGWNKDSLYALLNLRFSGWHSYKATNSFISVMYGEPFVVEKLELKNHSWLPGAKADNRDKKIDRFELNGFQIESTGLQKIIYQITGLGSYWAQDPPRFADVPVYNSTPEVDYAVTRISDWHGWDHTRSSFLVKGDDSFLAIFDQAKGKYPGKAGITWHFKGDVEILNRSIKLSNRNYSMNIHFPLSGGMYDVEMQKDEYLYPPAGEVHKPDFDYYMISKEGSEAGFITLFYPERRNQSYEIENIDITNYKNELIYPDALGIKISNQGRVYTLGKGNGIDILRYGSIDTNSEIFMMNNSHNSIEISFTNATVFNIISDLVPSSIELNGIDLIKDHDWNYSKNTIVLNNVVNQGFIRIKI